MSSLLRCRSANVCCSGILRPLSTPLSCSHRWVEIKLPALLLLHDFDATASLVTDQHLPRILGLTVLKFCRGSQNIDLIVTDVTVHSPIEIALLHHSTPAMNYITSAHVHCPFPTLTFRNQKAFNFKHSNAHQHGIKVALNKYAVKGHSTVGVSTAICAMGKNGELGAPY